MGISVLASIGTAERKPAREQCREKCTESSFMRRQPTYRNRSRGRPPWHVVVGLILALTALFGVDASGQNVIARGRITNNGTFRIQGNSQGMSGSLNGTFEYFGGNQSIAGQSYQTLLLSGTGTKSADSSITVFQHVTVAPAVTLQMQPGAVLRLDAAGGRLTENGYVSGKLEKSEQLATASASTDFGGIGLSVRLGAQTPGLTTVERISGTATVVNGKSSIRRQFVVTPAVLSTRFDTLRFSYASDEVTGQDTASLDLWRSIDGGTTWRRQHTVRDGTAKTLFRRGIPLAGMWTAADSGNIIGRPNYEWDPDSLWRVTPDSVRGRVGRILDAFIARVSDVYGNPVAGVPVTFRVVSTPTGAIGASLTQVSAVTDSLGNASTQLTLGNLRGDYAVEAKVISGSAPPTAFHAHADPGAVALPIAAGNLQTDSIRTVLPTALSVVAKDSAGIGVQGIPVAFTVIQAPAGATGQQFVSVSDTTDSVGVAHASFRFGTKAGTYVIRAVSAEIPGDSATFQLTATHGAPALAWKDNVARQDTIGTTLVPFVYTVTDGDTNAVPGRTVQFAVAQRPAGAVGDSLLTVSATTDSLGRAVATFRLGTKVGTYVVNAADAGLPNSIRAFSVTARPGLPAFGLAVVPARADTIGALLAPFTVRIADRGDNPVSGVPMIFAFAGTPAGTAGDSLLVLRAQTDTLGLAAVQVRLGDKAGDYSVRATSTAIPGYAGVELFRAQPGMPASVVVNSGANQSKSILQPLDSLIAVRLTDRAANAIPLDSVEFRIIGAPAGATGQVLSSSMAVTDSSGLASTQLMLGTKTGTYEVLARSVRRAGVFVSIGATARNGVAAHIDTSGIGVPTQPILTVLNTPFTVRITDVGGNAVPRASVTFSIAGRPAGAVKDSILTSTALTDSTGEARTVLLLGTKVGDYLVQAVTADLPGDTVQFRARATVGAPSAFVALAGAGQRAQIGDRLQAFTVHVVDVGENPVPNAAVAFRIVERPALASGDSLTVTTAKTDSAGRASTVMVLGSRPGRYTVQASGTGVRDTSFAAEAIFVLADVNNDNYQNIGDLTAIIDHILGRRILTGYDFIKADIDNNGVVDVRDALRCRDSLLVGAWNPVYNWTTQTYLGKKSGAMAAAASDPPENSGDGNAAVKSELQRTHIGARFYLRNSVPIKGLQATVFLKHPADIDTVDLVFPSAKMMNVSVRSVGNEVHMVLFNFSNTPIQADTGAPVFRLPLKLSSLSDIDSIRVVASVDTNVASLVPSATEDLTNSLPVNWTLYQNYPNPFNSSTTIEFDVPEVVGKVPRLAVQIFDLLGRKVITIEKGNYDAGMRYRVVWDGRNEAGEHVASGVYFYRLLAGDYVSTKKMVLLK